jgi:hypothetical protein
MAATSSKGGTTSLSDKDQDQAIKPMKQPTSSSYVSWRNILFAALLPSFLEVFFAAQQAQRQICKLDTSPGSAWSLSGSSIPAWDFARHLHPEFPCAASKVVQIRHSMVRFAEFKANCALQLLFLGPQHPYFNSAFLLHLLPILYLTAAVLLAAHQRFRPCSVVGDLLCLLHVSYATALSTLTVGPLSLLNTVFSLAAGNGGF